MAERQLTMDRRSPRWRRLVFTLAAKHGWRCWYCSSKVSVLSASLDHILPLAHGGTSDLDNIALACLFCNLAKSDVPVELFLDWLERVRAGDTLFQGL